MPKITKTEFILQKPKKAKYKQGSFLMVGDKEYEIGEDFEGGDMIGLKNGKIFKSENCGEGREIK